MIVCLMAVLLCCGTVHAAEPSDFYRGFALETESGFALQRLNLPFEVYNASARPDLGDMRVFNAEGGEVPLLVRGPRAATEEQQEIQLPVFPLRDVSGASHTDIRMHVRTSDQGTVLEAVIGPDNATPGQAFLLDASQNTRPLASLRVVLGAATDDLVPVTVQGSNDLATWRPVGSGVLSDIRHQNGRVLQDSITLSGPMWKYYLLSGQGRFPVLETVFGVTRPGSSAPARTWTALRGISGPENTMEYSLPPALPVDMLDLDGNASVVLGVRVLMPVSKKAWTTVRSGVLFQLSADGRTVAGPPLLLPGPLPKFRITTQGAPMPLRVGWTAHELVFLPQGSPPFVLAVGNPAISQGPDLVSPLLRTQGMEKMEMGRTILGPSRPLGGEDRLTPPRNFKEMALWGMLALGVLMMGAMAWHLVRTLDRPENPDDRG